MAKPFFKWAGGKRSSLKKLLAHVPRTFHTYHEPMVGGGALFFALQERGLLKHGAVLSDASYEVVNAYMMVRDDVDAVIRELRRCENDKDFFLGMRALDPESLTHVGRAARFLYITRVGFNGLWRVNKSGQCNTPFGKYTNPVICDEKTLRAASKALQGVRIFYKDVFMCSWGNGDFIYIDPPYWPVSDTANFTSYTANGFGRYDQIRLARRIRVDNSYGVKILASNADLPEVHELYEDFPIHVIRVPRAINSAGGKRGRVGEVLIDATQRAEL